MASNFRISTHKNKNQLHLTLIGDFDGISALQLVNVLKKNLSGSCRVFIHTNGLKCVYPFGRDTFHSHLGSLKAKSRGLVFMGENADEIAPLQDFGP